MSPLHVFIDTNALPQYPLKIGKAFRRLCDLCQEGVVRVYLSSVVVDELESRWRPSLEDNVKDADNAIMKILPHSWLENDPGIDSLRKARAYLSSLIENMHNISRSNIDELIGDLRAEVLDIDVDHGKAVFKAYFRGDAPFKHVKNRDDFPDAFIFQCAVDLVNKRGLEMHFIVGDKILSGGLGALEKSVTYADIHDFVTSDVVKMEVRRIDPESAWQETFERIRSKLPDMVKELEVVFDNREPYLDQITYAEIYHKKIPSDNSDALVAGVYGAENVVFEWDSLGDLGPGYVSVNVIFEIKADIEFDVFIGDAFSVSEEVFVDIGDPESNSFFDASSSVKLSVRVKLVLGFDWEDWVGDDFPELSDMSVDEIEDIKVVEDEKGGIFL